MNLEIDKSVDKFGIPSESFKMIISILKKNNKIKEIFLFGSRAKGNYKKGSDIDIAITADSLSLEELNQIRVEINNLALPYKVDVIDFNKISNNDLKEHILRVGKLIS
jgi:predicted nucleotidyltransferase